MPFNRGQNTYWAYSVARNRWGVRAQKVQNITIQLMVYYTVYIHIHIYIYIYTPLSTQKSPIEKCAWGIRLCKDYSMINQLKRFQNHFSGISEMIGKITETILFSRQAPID